jgi:hypothetical protein
MPKASAILSPVPAVSPFHNLSAGDLVDRLGSLKADMADLKAWEDKLRAELITRGVSEAEGDLFRASITEAARWTLDAERIREEMGEPWCTARSKVATVTTVRVSARTGSRKAA